MQVLRMELEQEQVLDVVVEVGELDKMSLLFFAFHSLMEVEHLELDKDNVLLVSLEDKDLLL